MRQTNVPPLSRRDVLAVTAAVVLAAPHVARAQGAAHVLAPLPYADNALAPVISADTIGFHYGKHHRAYVDTLNRLLETDPLKGRPLVEVVKATAGDAAKAGLFNNAAQIWNHDFYWRSLKPNGGGRPRGRLAGMIDAAFGDYDKFRTALAAQAVGQFGSGWAWLCLEGGKLTLRRTPNAETPVTVAGVTPLLTIDVWEHAYYLDYQNRRPDHVNAVIDKLLNWDFAEANLG